MALAKDTGFLLRKIPFSESSFILKVFTRGNGLVTLMAKGAKQPKSRYRGLLEPVLHLQFLFPEFSRSEIRILGEVSLLRDFPGLREDMAKQGLTRVFAEILLRYAPSESDAAQFHDLMFSAQEALEASPSHFLREGILRWLDAVQSGGEIPSLGRTDSWRAEEFLLHYLGRHAGGEKNLKSLSVWHELTGEN